MFAPNLFVRFNKSEDSLSKNDKFSERISGIAKEFSSVVVEVDFVNVEFDVDELNKFLLTGVFGETLPTDKGGELGDGTDEAEELLIFDEATTSDREGDNLASGKRTVGGESTELLRERDGVGGPAEGLRERLSLEFSEPDCVCI